MQAIINAIVDQCKAKYYIAKELINVLFEQNYTMPDGAESKRPSLLAFNNAIKCEAKPEAALASALLTLNSNHGVFNDAYSLLDLYFEKPFDFFKQYVIVKLSADEKIPGFGNPVIKTLDPRCEAIKKKFKELDEALFDEYQAIGNIVCDLIFQKTKKEIEPNIAYWNAAVMHFLGFPKTHSSLIFILAIQLKYLNRLWQQ